MCHRCCQQRFTRIPHNQTYKLTKLLNHQPLNCPHRRKSGHRKTLLLTHSESSRRDNSLPQATYSKEQHRIRPWEKQSERKWLDMIIGRTKKSIRFFGDPLRHSVKGIETTEPVTTISTIESSNVFLHIQRGSFRLQNREFHCRFPVRRPSDSDKKIKTIQHQIHKLRYFIKLNSLFRERW